MAEQSAFNKGHVEEATLVEADGLLEQLNLPPAMVAFLRKNKTIIWIIVFCIITAVTVTALYGTYTEYKVRKAANALTEAVSAEGDQKSALLNNVVNDYGSTPVGTWARVELAHLAVSEGRLDEGIETLLAIQGKIGSDNPLYTLVTSELAALYENSAKFDKAVENYKLLTGVTSFSSNAHEALGRIYEKQGKKQDALGMYEKYLVLTKDSGDAPLINRMREMIQARIHRLQAK